MSPCSLEAGALNWMYRERIWKTHLMPEGCPNFSRRLLSIQSTTHRIASCADLAMELLLLPHSPTSQRDKVPYVCSERYDGLSFLGYPERKGYSKFAQIPEYFEAYESLQPTPVAEQQSFFQTWLFFGLLSELFGGNDRDLPHDSAAKEGLVRPSNILDQIYNDFTTVESGCQYITVAKLVPYVDALLPITPNFSATFDELKKRYIHFKDCIMYTFRKLNTCRADFDQRIKYSMALVGEVLSYRVNIVLGYKLPITCPPTWGNGYYNADTKAAMIRHGWCPSEVARIADIFCSLQTMHLLSKVNKIQNGRSHDECTEDKCNSCQISLADYKVEHVDNACTCESVSVDNAAVIKILQKKGCIPLLDISFENNDLSKLRVDVVEQTADTAFVAISHVCRP